MRADDEDLTFLDLTFMRQFKGTVRDRSGPVIQVHSPASPTPVGGSVEAVVVRGPLRGMIRATVLEHNQSNLSLWVTSCELAGFRAREPRFPVSLESEVQVGDSITSCRIVNLSTGGAGIECQHEFDVGDLVVLRFSHDDHAYRCSFWVAWSERPVGRRSSCYGLQLDKDIRLSASDWRTFVRRLTRKGGPPSE